VFSALWGRALAHQQQSKQGQLYGRVAAEFRARQLWLDKVLARRMQLFQQNYPPTSVKVDSMLLFASLIAQATVLSLCKAVVSIAPTAAEYADLTAVYCQRAPQAAMDMVQLTAALTHLSSFKVKPGPILVFLSSRFSHPCSRSPLPIDDLTLSLLRYIHSHRFLSFWAVSLSRRSSGTIRRCKNS
jgi:hypothetical protein